MILNREQILAANDVKTKVVEVPEWGGSVIVRGLTSLERDKALARIMNDNNQIDLNRLGELRVMIAAMAIIDEQGNALFTEKDVTALGQKSWSAIERISDAVLEISGLTQNALEQLEKN